MKLIILLIATVCLTGCFPSTTRNVWGNGEEVVMKNVIPVDYSNKEKQLGYFTLQQYRRFWFGDLTSAETSLTFTNNTTQTLSYTFYVSFENQRWNTRYIKDGDHRDGARFTGHFRYTGSVINVQPGSTLSLGVISVNIYNLNDGTVTIRPDTSTLTRK